MALDSKEDCDRDITGILGQQAARRAAAIQVFIIIIFPVTY